MSAEPSVSAEPSLSRDGEVFVLDLGDGEKRVSPDWLATVSALVEEAAAAPAPRALVTTASGKVWAYGLDLGWIAANRDGTDDLVAALCELCARMLELPMATVAAIGGHAIAGGGLLALAHDVRVMRADRGWFCLPEVDVEIPVSPGLSDLAASRLTPATARDALLFGRRYGGVEAERAGIVDAAVEAGEVLPRALALARSLAGKHPQTFGTIKATLNRAAIASLRDRAANRADASRFDAAIALGV